jgi:hypothetical protein
MTYQVIAWAAVAFIVGVGVGMYMMRRWSGPSRQVRGDGLMAWSRRDVAAVAGPVETIVRNELVNGVPVDDCVSVNGHVYTFSYATVAGVRDVSFTGREMSNFVRCDTPSRYEWRGANETYKRLVAVAVHYQWIYRDGRGYQWAGFMATRERRLRALRAWADK